MCKGFTLEMITRSLSRDYARILFLETKPLIPEIVFLECRTRNNFQRRSSVRFLFETVPSLACAMLSSMFWLPVLVLGRERELSHTSVPLFHPT